MENLQYVFCLRPDRKGEVTNRGGDVRAVSDTLTMEAMLEAHARYRMQPPCTGLRDYNFESVVQKSHGDMVERTLGMRELRG
jgi:hypothetical protein